MGIFSRAFQWQPEEDASDQETYDDAALDQLGLGWFLNGVMGDISAERTATMRKRIAEKREWAATLSEAKWRRAFNRWLDHAERCCAEADRYREERPDRDREWAKSEAKRRAANEAARDLLRSNPPTAIAMETGTATTPQSDVVAKP